MKKHLFFVIFLVPAHLAGAQNVGIGTTTPQAKLHVSEGSTVFTAAGDTPHPSDASAVPVSGEGRRLMWYADKAAFRAGYTIGTQWDTGNVGLYSIAMGESTVASDVGAAAIGAGARATGSVSFATGYNTFASGGYSVATGNQSVASGENATAIGYKTEASGDYSTTMGYESRGSGSYAIAAGFQSVASGRDAAIAMGYKAEASGTSSIAIGYQSSASFINAMAIGNMARATNWDSKAIGDHVNAFGYGATAIGTYSDAEGNGSLVLGTQLKAEKDASFAMGRYAHSIHRGAFVIGDLESHSAEIVSSSSENEMSMRFRGGYRLFTNGASTIGASLAPGGTSWGTISDSTRKENFRPADGRDFLKKIASLRLGSWNYKGQDKTAHRHYGPMAQEFFAAFGYDGIGVIGTDTTITTADIDGVMMIAIKALISENEELKTKSKKLEAESSGWKVAAAELTRRMARLEELLESSEPILSARQHQD